jgi:hypothetical protein
VEEAEAGAADSEDSEAGAAAVAVEEVAGSLSCEPRTKGSIRERRRE